LLSTAGRGGSTEPVGRGVAKPAPGRKWFAAAGDRGRLEAVVGVAGSRQKLVGPGVGWQGP